MPHIRALRNDLKVGRGGPGRFLLDEVSAPAIGGVCACLLVLAVALATVAPSAVLGATADGLVAEADRLREGPDASGDALRHAFTLYQQAARLESSRADIQVRMAEIALEIAEVADDPVHWYTLGARAAEGAVHLDRTSADAHFLLAANRGQLASRQRSLLAVTVPGELEQHLSRALAVNPRHARALHMMGVLLRDTPWPLNVSLQGSRAAVGRYLVAAVDADPNFTEARLDLAHYYRGRGEIAQARAQAEAVLQTASRAQSRTWREKYRSAAEALLRELPVKE